jgi:translation initiation factor 4G
MKSRPIILHTVVQYNTTLTAVFVGVDHYVNGHWQREKPVVGIDLLRTMATWEVENDQEERNQQSLLVQALSVPPVKGHSRYRREPIPVLRERESSHSSGLSLEPEPGFLGTSDFTIPTSNMRKIPDAPDELMQPTHGRRSIFGPPVTQRYRIARVESTDTLPTEHIDTTSYDQTLSDLTPPVSPLRILPSQLVSPLTPYDNESTQHDPRKQRAHETIHAQSLLLGLAFMAVWSPQNGMAPNLTAISDDFGFSAAERDLYLGSVLALANGVLSLPLSAGIGILADVYNRKHLFVLTVAMGGLCSCATGASHSYRWLFWARLANGGFMSGSVPVAFSLLGDLFHTNERNAASSGLTAMMGMGIIIGQVYAGVVGSTLGWPHMFYVSAVWTVLTAILVSVFVQEPARGGKEQVLQDMLRQGTNYDRKLTWAGFFHAMRHNKSNAILMWQGFFSSVPWGIIFVFLNDYLSQERGFSVPDATYLVFMFGLGCAVGGVLGGWWGQVFSMWNRSYLPIFMAGTTFLGVFPFVGLLNGSFTNAHGVEAVFYSFMGGLIASLPSVNVRPCIINVNPPETRGAALTAANLIVCLARGIGPSCITLMGAIWHVNRRFSFNVTVRMRVVLNVSEKSALAFLTVHSFALPYFSWHSFGPFRPYSFYSWRAHCLTTKMPWRRNWPHMRNPECR